MKSDSHPVGTQQPEITRLLTKYRYLLYSTSMSQSRNLQTSDNHCFSTFHFQHRFSLEENLHKIHDESDERAEAIPYEGLAEHAEL